MSVAKNERLLALQQTRRLQFRNTIQAFIIDLDCEAARQERCPDLELRGVIVAAWIKSCDVRTNAPGRPRTAPTNVLKSPPVSGARNRSTCCAPGGTVTVSPSRAHSF